MNHYDQRWFIEPATRPFLSHWRLTVRSFFLVVAAIAAVPCGLCSTADAPKPPSDLIDYVKKADDSFSWKLAGKKESDSGTVYEIDLVSQTWHDIKWDH